MSDTSEQTPVSFSNATRFVVQISGEAHELRAIPGDLVRLAEWARTLDHTPDGMSEAMWMCWRIARRRNLTGCTWDEWLDGVCEDLTPEVDAPKAETNSNGSSPP